MVQFDNIKIEENGVKKKVKGCKIVDKRYWEGSRENEIYTYIDILYTV